MLSTHVRSSPYTQGRTGLGVTWMGVPLTTQQRSALTAAAACACCVAAFLMVCPSSSAMRNQLVCTACAA